MKKIVLLALLFTLALSAMAQKRVAVYVAGNDPKVKDYVAGEMVKVISQGRKYTAVNRSDDFSKQLQNERSYQQSGKVDDRQIAKLGKENGVDYVCAVNVTRNFVEARLIDVETGDILVSDKEDGYFEDQLYLWGSKDKEKVISIAQNISNYNPNSGEYLIYCKDCKSKVVQYVYGIKRDLFINEVSGLLVSNPEAFELYEKGLEKVYFDKGGNETGWCCFFGGIGTVCFGIWALFGIDPPKLASIGTAGSVALMTFGIVHPKIVRRNGEKMVRKAVDLYNKGQNTADNLEISVGFGMNSIGLTLRF